MIEKYLQLACNLPVSPHWRRGCSATSLLLDQNTACQSRFSTGENRLPSIRKPCIICKSIQHILSQTVKTWKKNCQVTKSKDISRTTSLFMWANNWQRASSGIFLNAWWGGIRCITAFKISNLGFCSKLSFSIQGILLTWKVKLLNVSNNMITII